MDDQKLQQIVQDIQKMKRIMVITTNTLLSIDQDEETAERRIWEFQGKFSKVFQDTYLITADTNESCGIPILSKYRRDAKAQRFNIVKADNKEEISA